MKAILTAIFTVINMMCFAQSHVFFSPEMIFTHLKSYTEEEKIAINKDLKVVRSVCFSENGNPNKKRPVYITTAGSPGSRKTTILERFLQAHKNHPYIYEPIYLDPDQRGLKFMTHTYYSRSLNALTIGQQREYNISAENAYEKWRGASNYIALTLLEEAFLQRRDIAYGATSTGSHIGDFLSNVKNAGYSIILLLCSCEDSFVAQAIDYRNNEQKFYQSTPEDILSKRKLFAQRMPIYFLWADELYIYWSDDLFTPERLAAVIKENQLQVIDADALENFKKKYEKDRALLAEERIDLPTWNELIGNNPSC